MDNTTNLIQRYEYSVGTDRQFCPQGLSGSLFGIMGLNRVMLNCDLRDKICKPVPHTNKHSSSCIHMCANT